MLRESPPVYLAVGRRAFLRVTRSLRTARRRGEPIVALHWCPNLEAASREMREGLHVYPTVVVGVAGERAARDLLSAGACEVLPANATAAQLRRAGERAATRVAVRLAALEHAETWMRAVAHEIRSPLDGCLRSLRLALEDDPRTRSPRGWLARAQAALLRIQKTIERLLHSRVEVGTRWATRDLHALVAEAIEAAGGPSPRLLSTVSIGFASAPDLLLPVLSNLLRNALQAAGKDGTVRITARRGEGEIVRICVEDDGPGMPAAIRARLGRPVPATRQGRGLGLSIARDLVRRMGGRVRVATSSEGGTRVAVEIPSASAPRGIPAPEATR